MRRALVIAGAGGERGLTDVAIAALRRHAPCARIAVVQGPYSPAAGGAGAAPSASLDIVGSDDLYPEMLDSDLAVSAAGQTALELALTGTPAVVAAIVENQRRNAEGLAARGLAVNAGSLGAPDFGARVEAGVRLLATDPGARARFGIASLAAVDGRGADRVADVLESLMSERFA